MMGAVVAVGGIPPIPPSRGTIDVAPLVTVLLALVAVRVVLGIRLTWPVVVGVVVGGTALGFAIEAWGIGIPTAVAVALGAIASGALHRRARRGT
jgi:hypothetical protein